jgi:hypothetical protein
MARPVLKKTEKALALLDKPHPKYPNRNFTVFEAAAKYGVGLTTMYRHINKSKQQGEKND